MCTELRLVRVEDLHAFGQTMDFAYELGSRVQVVPVGLVWSATETPKTSSPTLRGSLAMCTSLVASSQSYAVNDADAPTRRRPSQPRAQSQQRAA